MLIKAKTLTGYKLDALDGEIGHVEEVYFDDKHWTVRYLVVETHKWFSNRQVLISPYALGAVSREERQIAVDLTKQQIEDSPSLDSDKPVSLQFERSYFGYYGYPMYWGGPYVWGTYPEYPYIVRDREKWRTASSDQKSWDHNLRSSHHVSGYRIQATDGEIGHVDDFIIDDVTWGIRYLVVDTLNWWPGKKVLISPKWIDRVSWGESKVFVGLLRDTIKKSPEYTAESLPTRDYEVGLYEHYNRNGYWMDEIALADVSH